MSLQEGQPIRDDFDGITDAYKDFCGCPKAAAAAIVSGHTKLMIEVYEASMRRLAAECVEEIEKHAKGEPR